MARRFERWTMQARWVRCGKARCKTCPHGPYWYGYRESGGRTESKYFGRNYPHGAAAPPPPPPGAGGRPPERTHPHDAIHSPRTASARLAKEILGIADWPSLYLPRLKAHFRELCKVNHPDRGGDRDTMSRMNSAYAYLERMLRGE